MSGAPAVGTPWPQASLDRISRLRLLAVGLPGVAVRETVFDAPFDQVWSRLTDFERSVPAFDADVAQLDIVDRAGHPEQGERLRIATRQTARMLWLPAVLDMDLAPGWCWMVTRPQLYVVGMAAEPAGDRTRFAHLEGFAFISPRSLRPLLRPLAALSRWRHRRHLAHDIAGMKRFLSGELPP